MERFLERHQSRVVGVLSGFDRVLFRGTLRSISYLDGFDRFLGYHGVLYKNFGSFVGALSQTVKAQVQAMVEQSGRPYLYLESSTRSKEKIAQTIAERDKITEGLICVLGCVEPCQSFAIRKDSKTKKLRIVTAQRKCLHYYFYYLDREFGLMHVRLESWLPFAIQVCLNGREYLARRLEKAGIGFQKRDNCFTQIDDLKRAQEMLDALVTRKWEHFLNMLARRVNPLLAPEVGLELYGYYWTFRQSEYATDVMFKDAEALKGIYPRLVSHAIDQFHSKDALRFLGRHMTASLAQEVTSQRREFFEGVRVKHWVGENSIKMYDKQQSVLRIETTINNPRDFKSLREATRKGQPCLAWLPMRKGLADIARRVEVSCAANQRYLEALAVVDEPAPTKEVLDPLSCRVIKQGRTYRPLRPIEVEEAKLFHAVLRGEHLLHGFRNRDIRELMAPGLKPRSTQTRTLTGQITRALGLLRAHGLIRKVPRTTRYRITTKGHQAMTTALRLREIDVTQIAA
jgi:DNA-binding PadR family transcriptional regulator